MKYLSIIAILFLSVSVFGVDFTVNLTTDEHDADTSDGICLIPGGGCSLRAAIEQANTTASDDRVLFALPPNSTITLTSANGGEIVTTNSFRFGTLQIVGTGASNLTIDGGIDTNRIFYITSTGTISGVTLTGGNATGARFNNIGGAILAQEGSALTLNSVLVTGNSAPTGQGGGVYYQSAGSHLIINSTFSGNSAQICAAVMNGSSTVTAINSTFSGNITPNSGGGFCVNNGRSTLRNVTITNNSASQGGGIIAFAGSNLTIGNSIVAGNISTSNSNPEIQNPNSEFTSLGNNIIGDSVGDSADTGKPITYQSTDILDTPPMFGTLQNNGGQTPTHALLSGSPAIDKGNNSLAIDASNNPLLFDQRGTPYARIIDGNGDLTATVDIGAYESPMGTTAAAVTISGRVVTNKGRGISRAMVTITDARGNVRTAYTRAFGYYRFEAAGGENYILTVSHRLFTFVPRLVFAGNDLTMDFTEQ